MTKFNFFLVVEALLLTLGLITIFNNDITSFIFILVLTLLAVRFFNKESKSDFVLTISLISLFLVSMWNIYVVLAILVGVAYVMINHFSQVKKKNRYALIQFKEDNLEPRAVRNQWIGTRMEPVSDRYDFDDINIIRFFGTDVIDLTQVIVSGRDNVVILQKLYGPTTILVPIDVSVKLNISAIYSSVTFFNEDEYDLRYESLTLQGADAISYPVTGAALNPARATGIAIFAQNQGTGVFQYSCTSSSTMNMAGMLMDKGIDFTKIVDESSASKAPNLPNPSAENKIFSDVSYATITSGQ